ncbi:hypothetical protein P3X46_020178 [Hevea brasiliensis]|uniref:Rho termination factor-like N-terminal domain-containing protein n=1 Tax=Hevea brasiliensis TaxID=3981 RepID=A0ABQ9LL54_HEVBR|nr:SAP-like protein BP-73 isoform X2 [Hevea brasiliensis]KAJ9168682.1 hypothetical protein P3X46_020178 [Hevea brasiliensis]
MWPRKKEKHRICTIRVSVSVAVNLIRLHIQNLRSFLENMNAVVFNSRSFFNLPSCFSFSKQLNLGKPVYSLRDGHLAFASQKDERQLSVSNTKYNGSSSGRPPRKSSASRRTKKEDESEISQSSDGKLPMSPKQEEIISLFRRIQSSISKGEGKEAKSTKQTNHNLSPTESIVEILRQSKKPIKDGTTKRGDKVLTRKRSVKKDDKVQDDAQHAVANFNLTRPPSNFVKRSPIPSPSIARGNAIELSSDPSTTTDSDKVLVLPRTEEMKLSELKELAKSRGLKGYSKLKKGELLEWLRS